MYEYLLPYTNKPVNPNPEKIKNWFYSIPPGEVENTEKTLGIVFPSELKRFYQEIGYGSLSVPHSHGDDYDFFGSNKILSPDMILHIMGSEGGDYMDKSTFELLSPGDIPVFEVGDSYDFMFMKTHSDNPNAVWYQGMEKIEDSFERFIWRLYYEDPSYYSVGWADEYMAKDHS